MVAAAVLVLSLFLLVLALDRSRRRPARERRGELGLRRGQRQLLGLGHVPDPPLAAARRGNGAVHPRLDRDAGTRSSTRGELTAIVGVTAFVLIAYNGIVDKPNDGLQMDLAIGYWLAMLASLAIFVSRRFRAVESGGARGASRRRPVAVACGRY